MKVVTAGFVALVLCLCLSGDAAPPKAVGTSTSFIDTTGVAPGRYAVVLVVGSNGSITLEQPKNVIRLADVLSGTTPSPPISSTLSQKVKSLTAQVTDKSKEENAAGLSVVYSAVSSQVAAGKLTGAQSLQELKKLTDAFLKARGAAEYWKNWRLGVGAALQAESTAGRLGDSQAYAAAYQTIAASLVDTAKSSGKKLNILSILKVLLEIFQDGKFEFDLGMILKILLQLL